MKKRTLIIILAVVVLMVFSLLFVRMTGLVVTSINTCLDGDNGKNYNVKARVFGDYYLFTKQSFYEEDKCENDKTLIEYYCISDGLHFYKESVKFKCTYGCKNGQCLGGEGVEMPEKTGFLDKVREFLRKLV